MRVLNHAGVCMSYEATWQHIQQLIFEAGYADVVKQGSWTWIYDNLNLMRKVRHERSGSYGLTIILHTSTYFLMAIPLT